MKNKFTLGDEVYVVSTARDAKTDKVHAVVLRDTITGLYHHKLPKGLHDAGAITEEIAKLSCGVAHHSHHLAFTLEEAFELVEQNRELHWEAINRLILDKGDDVRAVEVRDYTGKSNLESKQPEGSKNPRRNHALFPCPKCGTVVSSFRHIEDGSLVCGECAEKASKE